MTNPTHVLAIDQGTTSSRAIIFDHDGRIVAVGQKEHEQIFPRAGWVEHDAVEIWGNVREVVAQALAKAQLNKIPSTTPSSGRTPAPKRSSRNSAASREPTGTRSSSGCRWPPTSPGRRSSGSSTTSRAPGNAPRPVTW